MTTVIAGASAGIGQALAERLSAKGERVLGISRKTGYDLSDRASAQLVADSVGDSYRSIDALVITAGHQAALGRLGTCRGQDWLKAINDNLGVVFNTIHAFYPLLKTAPSPRIICLSGGGATNGRPYFSAYACAKTAVVRLVETMAEEEPNFHINAVAPGALNTRMLDELIAAGPITIGHKEWTRAEEQKKTGGDSMESALELIEFLLGADSNGITGKLISARWDAWRSEAGRAALRSREIGTLRRIT